MARIEATAHIPVEGLARLIGAASGGTGLNAADLTATLDRIEARLTLAGDTSQHWQGRVLRVENALDPQARSVPVVIAVDDPYAGAN
ncbi:hypothetical protein HA397_27715, partial [Escherichia coli]|nr:hypothetical protein [Escherichia coli]